MGYPHKFEYLRPVLGKTWTFLEVNIFITAHCGHPQIFEFVHLLVIVMSTIIWYQFCTPTTFVTSQDTGWLFPRSGHEGVKNLAVTGLLSSSNDANDVSYIRSRCVMWKWRLNTRLFLKPVSKTSMTHILVIFVIF